MPVWGIVLFVIFFVGIISLIAYKVITSRDNFTEADAAFLPYLKLNPEWTPITLMLGESIEDRPMVKPTVVDAADFWNASVGFPLFTDVGDFLANNKRFIYIKEAPPEILELKGCQCSAYAWTQILFDKDKVIQGATVWLLPGWDGENVSFLADAVKHELGHVLGLAHDTVVNSIMVAKLDGDQTYVVTDQDVQLLTEAYA